MPGGELQRLDAKCVYSTIPALPAWCWMQLKTINILILHSEEYSVFKAHELHFVLLFAAGLMSAPGEDSFRHLCEPHTTAVFKTRSWKWETAEFAQWTQELCKLRCRLQMLPSEWHSKSSSLDSHPALRVTYQRRASNPDISFLFSAVIVMYMGKWSSLKLHTWLG